MRLPLIALSALLPLSLAASVPVRPPSPTLLPFQEFLDDMSAAGTDEIRTVFTSRDEYEAFFGHRSPVDVDWDHEYVVFYSAGLKMTAGYDARILSIKVTEAGQGLLITTQLEEPGPDCIVAMVLTTPAVLAKFPIPPRNFSVVRFQRLDTVKNCAQ